MVAYPPPSLKVTGANSSCSITIEASEVRDGEDGLVGRGRSRGPDLDCDRPFDYSGSRAVLIGTSRYQDGRFPRFRRRTTPRGHAADPNQSRAMRLACLPVKQLSSESGNRQLIIKLRKRAGESTGVFLLYDAGHGTPGENKSVPHPCRRPGGAPRRHRPGAQASATLWRWRKSSCLVERHTSALISTGWKRLNIGLPPGPVHFNPGAAA
jgi:hypothetical protein